MKLSSYSITRAPIFLHKRDLSGSWCSNLHEEHTSIGVLMTATVNEHQFNQNSSIEDRISIG